VLQEVKDSLPLAEVEAVYKCGEGRDWYFTFTSARTPIYYIFDVANTLTTRDFSNKDKCLDFHKFNTFSNFTGAHYYAYLTLWIEWHMFRSLCYFFYCLDYFSFCLGGSSRHLTANANCCPFISSCGCCIGKDRKFGPEKDTIPDTLVPFSHEGRSS
jgi:hypothetical protein